MQMKILRHQGSPKATDELYSLASGLDRRVSLCHSCVVNGIRFHTKDRDDQHTTQNSGVLVSGDHYEDMIDFYGVLLNVVMLDYIFNNQVVLFKCEWFDIDHKNKKNGKMMVFLGALMWIISGMKKILMFLQAKHNKSFT